MQALSSCLEFSSYRFSPAHPSFKSPVQGQATHPQAMSPHSKQLTPTKQGSVASPPLPYEVQAVEVDLGPDVDECHQKAAQSGEFSFEDRNKVGANVVYSNDSSNSRGVGGMSG